MTDYISREEALDALAPFCKDCRFADDEENCAQCPHGYIRLKLNAIPGANVRPVVRGKWNHDWSDWKNRFICDQCGYKWFFEAKEANFCPNCGAEMMGGTP